MNCTEFEIQFVKMESRAELPPELPETMQEHMRSCRACSAMVEDQTFLARQARVLRPMQAPGEHVWQRIRAALLAEGLIRVPAPAGLELDSVSAGGVPAGVPPPGKSLSRVPMSLAYGAVLMLAVGVMYFYSLFSGPGAQPPTMVVQHRLPAIALRSAPSAPASESALADAARPQEGPLESAPAEPSDGDLQQLVLKVPEEYRATVVSSWNQLNSAHDEVSDYLHLHPEDPFAHHQHVIIEEQMRRFAEETFARWNDF